MNTQILFDLLLSILLKVESMLSYRNHDSNMKNICNEYEI